MLCQFEARDKLLSSKMSEEPFDSFSNVYRYIDSKRLSFGTQIRGPLEVSVAKVLREFKLTSYYHLFPFPTSYLTMHRPDFLVPEIEINGKPLVLNPHHARVNEQTYKATEMEFLNISGFYKRYADEIYHIIISSHTRRTIEHQYGIPIDQIADEHLLVRNHGRRIDTAVPVIREMLAEKLAECGRNESYKDRLTDLLIRIGGGEPLREKLALEMRGS